MNKPPTSRTFDANLLESIKKLPLSAQTCFPPLYYRSLYPPLDDEMGKKWCKKLQIESLGLKYDDFSVKDFGYRSRWFDDRIVGFLKKYPSGMILSLGCGMNTTYFRVQKRMNLDSINWVDIDVVEIIRIKRKLMNFPENYNLIIHNVNDTLWMDRVGYSGQPVMILCEGSLMYLPPKSVHDMFEHSHKHFDVLEIAFDYISPMMKDTENLTKTPFIGENIYNWALKHPKKLKEKGFIVIKNQRIGHSFRGIYRWWVRIYHILFPFRAFYGFTVIRKK